MGRDHEAWLPEGYELRRQDQELREPIPVRQSPPRRRAPLSNPVEDRREETELFSLRQLTALEQQRQQAGAAWAPAHRESSHGQTEPRVVIDAPPPPLPMGLSDALPRNRSFLPVLLAVCAVLVGGVTAVVIAIARNT